MRISKVIMKNFKYFDDLTIKVSDEKRVILLVGPNGCGKSCVFDAFTNYVRLAKIGNEDNDMEYIRKNKDEEHNIEIFDENKNLIKKEWAGSPNTTKFYGRTAYRFTKDIDRTSITQSAGQAVKNDERSPERFNDLDQRIEDDIEAALGHYLEEVQKGGRKTADAITQSVIGPTNKSLKNIFGKNGIQLKRILNPFDKTGSAKIDLLFIKEGVDFLYKNLSAGEKEIFDIIFNFYRRADFHIEKGIYFIDEPELHIHANIQKKLLKELKRLCKFYKAQLWVATHSIGFIKAAHETKDSSIGIYEFSPKLANGSKILKPSRLDWKGWQKVFKVSLDDLATLILPKQIIYCEGDPKNTGFDERIYNIIFGKRHTNSIFVSSGGGTVPLNNALFALIVFQKLSSNVELIILKDRDNMGSNTRKRWLKSNPNRRILKRMEIENYLLDFEVLKKLNSKINENEYKKIVNNVKNDDLKKVKQKLKVLCKDRSKTMDEFMIKLARKLPQTSVYKKLESLIFTRIK